MTLKKRVWSRTRQPKVEPCLVCREPVLAGVPCFIDLASVSTAVAHQDCLSPIGDVDWPTLVNQIETAFGTRDSEFLKKELHTLDYAIREARQTTRRMQTIRFVLHELLYNPEADS